MLLDYDIPSVQKTPEDIATANDMQNVMSTAIQPAAISTSEVNQPQKTGGDALNG